jgi:hypothetical protein
LILAHPDTAFKKEAAVKRKKPVKKAAEGAGKEGTEAAAEEKVTGKRAAENDADADDGSEGEDASEGDAAAGAADAKRVKKSKEAADEAGAASD